MKKVLMFTVLATIAFVVAAAMAYRDYRTIEDLSFSGVVTTINWHSQNHDLPLIVIRTPTGIMRVQSYRLTLNSGQLKPGDQFQKVAGSLTCTINEKVVPCIR